MSPSWWFKTGRGAYKVVEGNRRVAACTLLNNPELAPDKVQRRVRSIAAEAAFKPTEIPALVFDAETDILRYLGYRHISGVQEWSPLAKARYIERLLTELSNADGEDERLQWVANRIGSTPTYAARLLTSLALYERTIERDFFELPISRDDFAFSLITVAIGRRSINQFLGLQSSKDYSLANLNEDHLRELLEYVYVRIGNPPRSVLGDSRNVAKLAAVIGDPTHAALDTLRRTRDLDRAHDVLEPDPSGLSQVLVEIREALVELASEVAAGRDGITPEDRRELREIRRTAKRLIKP